MTHQPLTYAEAKKLIGQPVRMALGMEHANGIAGLVREQEPGVVINAIRRKGGIVLHVAFQYCAVIGLTLVDLELDA